MKFSVFDHMDRGVVSLQAHYANRLKLVEAYDRGGFYAYHVAEHHSTPLGVAPSPSVYLSAVAQRTTRLRFGPLVYTLSLHHPLRVMEEICMLDLMSNGRLEIGFGKGISPYELSYYGVDPNQAQGMYLEAYEIIMQGLTQDKIHFHGEHFNFSDVPVEIACVQQPTPPRWYGLANPQGAHWAAENRMNVVCNGLPAQVREITHAYRAAWDRLGREPQDLPFMGVSRHIVVADTDEQALDIARRGYDMWFQRLMYLWVLNGTRPPLSFPDTFDEAQRLGLGVAGSVETVGEWIQRDIESTGVNYYVCRLAFGDLSYENSLRSTELLSGEIMPALSAQFV